MCKQSKTPANTAPKSLDHHPSPQPSQSQLSPSNPANFPNSSSSTSSNPPTTVQSTSIIATTYPPPISPIQPKKPPLPPSPSPFHPPTHLPTPPENRHHNLTPTLPIASNMPRELPHVLDPHGPLLRGRGTAHAAAERDALARRAAVEGAEDETRRGGPCGGAVVERVEAGPVDVAGGRGRGKGVVEVVEEGGGVG